MSGRLESRTTAFLLLAATLSLCLTSHGSVLSRIQSAQVRKNLQKGSKLEQEDQFHLKITEQQSDPAPNRETPSTWSSQTGIIETKDSKSSKVPPAFHQSSMFPPGQENPDGKELFQSDSPGFDVQAVQGNIHFSTSQVTEEWFQMRPVVQCSPAAIILSAKGWNYVHLLVDRVGASPLSVLHLPSYCGFNVKATWRDLVLMAPYDGCYILQQNGSYVLPLLWCGMHVSISCPISPASAHATPSGFCSHLGITLKIMGSQRGIETYSIKVNKKWVPLVSNTCAYRMDSAPEDLILFIPFTVQCAEGEGSTLDVLLDGKLYTLSCQPQHYLPRYPQFNPSPPFSQLLHPLHSQVTLLDPAFNKPELSKPPLVPEKEQSQHHILLPSERTAVVSSTEITAQHPQQSYDVLLVPVQQTSKSSARRTKITIPFQSHFGHLQLNIPVVHPPYEHFLQPIYPYYQNVYVQKPISPDTHQRPAHPQVTQRPAHPQVTQRPAHPQVTQRPAHPQVTQRPAHPQVTQRPHHRFPVLANESSLFSPLLTCKGDSFRASLPSAKMNSIKVKDVKRKVWVPVSSAPVHCGYLVKRNGKGVEFSSPIPACHSYTVSPSLLSLSLKFSDLVKPRRHAVRLECPYTSPSLTTSSTTASLGHKPIFSSPQPTSHEIQPPCPQKPLCPYSATSKPGNFPVNFQKTTVPPLYPDKPSAPSFQSPIFPNPTFRPPKLTSLSQTTSMASQMHQPQVLCHSKDMSVTLPHGPITGLTVQSPTGERSIKAMLFDEAPSHCGYMMKKNENNDISILMPYKSCHMAYQDGQYRVLLKYQTADNERVEAYLSCQIPTDHECNFPVEQRLTCGSSSVSAAECRDLGCCFCTNSQTCFYPMDECTADQHFIFSIPASITEPPLSPALLAAAGNNSCTPQKVVADLALFKIPLDGCGAHKYEVGNTVIYMLEILNTLKSVTLNYGTITRDSPFRLLVECRYLPSTVSSVGYLVKSPTLGPSIQAQGVFGVQLRIAKDKHYRSYYPQYHRPLRKLLGKPLYLEVRLLNPVDSSTVLLVHYCVAYPRSAHSAWVLIYDGCPNPFDVAPSHEPPPTPSKGLANHVRRFTVSTFQFLEISRKMETAPGMEKVEEKREEEEIYFMCATEVCLPSEGPCIEGCIDRATVSPAVKS